MKIKTFEEFVAYCKRKFPRGSEPEALWARRVVAGWRCYLDKEGATEPERIPAADDSDAEFYRAEATRQAQLCAGYQTVFSPTELGDCWLAVHGRNPSGHRFEEVVG